MVPQKKLLETKAEKKVKAKEKIKVAKALAEEDVPENLEEIVEDIQETAKDIDEIQEDVDEIQEDVDEIQEDVEEIQSDVKEIKKSQQSLLRNLSSRFMPEKYEFDDLAQQIVGAIILSTPLAVTQEVWMLSQALDIFRIAAILLITIVFNILLIYYTKYQIVKKEKILSFLPLRLSSQLTVAYISAALILWVFGVIGGQVIEPFNIAKLIIFVGLFANIGAGTADMLK